MNLVVLVKLAFLVKKLQDSGQKAINIKTLYCGWKLRLGGSEMVMGEWLVGLIGHIVDYSEKYPGKLGKILMRPKKKGPQWGLLTSVWFKNPEKYSTQIQKKTRKNTPENSDNLSVVHKRAILWEIFNNKKTGKTQSAWPLLFLKILAPFLSYIKRQNTPKYGNLSRNFHIYLTASGEGGREGGQPKRSAWPLFPSFLLLNVSLTSFNDQS